MTSPRKIIAYLATSADGFIARPDGDVEWLNRRPSTIDYGMKAFYRSIDTAIMGRKTYDWAMDYTKKSGAPGPAFDPRLANYVFSHETPTEVAPKVKFVSGPVKGFVKRLRAKPGKNIWLMGGGELIASFLDAGLIDEFDVQVIPTLIGDGIAMIAPRHRDVALDLKSAKKYADGVVRLRYEVIRKPARG